MVIQALDVVYVQHEVGQTIPTRLGAVELGTREVDAHVVLDCYFLFF